MPPRPSTDSRCQRTKIGVRAVLVEALLPKGLVHLSGRLAKPREAIRTDRRFIHGNQSSTSDRFSSIRLIQVLTMN